MKTDPPVKLDYAEPEKPRALPAWAIMLIVLLGCGVFGWFILRLMGHVAPCCLPLRLALLLLFGFLHQLRFRRREDAAGERLKPFEGGRAVCWRGNGLRSGHGDIIAENSRSIIGGHSGTLTGMSLPAPLVKVATLLTEAESVVGEYIGTPIEFHTQEELHRQLQRRSDLVGKLVQAREALNEFYPEFLPSRIGYLRSQIEKELANTRSVSSSRMARPKRRR